MSSLLFLGFSVIAFLISYGLMFYLVPMILSPLYQLDTSTMDADWLSVHNQTKAVVQWIIPLVPTIGLMLLVVKVLMVATTRGGND